MHHLPDDPHAGQPVLTTGRPLDEAGAAMILVHGRGATAESILTLAQELPNPEFAYLAPQAAYNAWYPQRFIAPFAANEPFLSAALAKVGAVLAQVEAAGIPPERIVLGGFSQGACLALEFAARNPRRYGGLVALSGGLIGPLGHKFSYDGSLDGTPVFIGCSDSDFHIPVERVHESAEVLAGLGGQVDKRIYPGMGHTVNMDEIEAVRQLLAAVPA
ncbi:MAG: dienelactone hydrolase family protein [Anaerolineae bacterium]